MLFVTRLLNYTELRDDVAAVKEMSTYCALEMRLRRHVVLQRTIQMTSVELKVTSDGTATIEVSTASHGDLLEQALTPIPDLVTALMDAEVLLSDFPEALPLNRQRAALAVAMKAAYHLEQAQRLFQGVSDLTAGNANAAEFGFPEFIDEAESENFAQ